MTIGSGRFRNPKEEDKRCKGYFSLRNKRSGHVIKTLILACSRNKKVKLSRLAETARTGMGRGKAREDVRRGGA